MSRKIEVMKLKTGMRIEMVDSELVVERVIKHGRFCKEIALVGVPEYNPTGWKNWPVLDNHHLVTII